MGCNCKKANKLSKKYPEFLKPSYKKKGGKKVLNVFKSSIQSLFKNVGMFGLCLIGFPIILSIALFNKIFKDGYYVRIPFLKKGVKET